MSGSENELFDTHFALAQFSGNQDLLTQILGKFIEQYKDAGPLLQSHIQQDNDLQVKQLVHTIKGVSGNLGMKALHLASKEFENTLRSNVSTEQLSEYLAVLQSTLVVAQEFCSVKSEGADDETSHQTSEAGDKDLLIQALKRNEFISESKLQGYLDALNLAPEQLVDIKTAIDDLDYSQALSILQ